MQSSSGETEAISHPQAFINTLRAFKSALASYPALWIGFACICAWPWSCTSATLVHSDALAIGSPLWYGSNFTYLIIGLVGFAIAFSPARLNKLSLVYSIPFIAA